MPVTQGAGEDGGQVWVAAEARKINLACVCSQLPL